jgi:trehalose-phosphatase
LSHVKPLWLSLKPIAQRLRRHERVLVASDFDGTLCPIVERPEIAALTPRTRRVLSRLSHLENMDIAIISGRGLRDLRRLVRLPAVFLSGAVGLETLEPGGRRETHVPADRALPPGLADELREWSSKFPGAWLEDKRLELALHYRDVPTRFHAALGAGIRRQARTHHGRAVLVHGKRVYEVLPRVSWNKASALHEWWDKRGNGLLFSFGDDTHDEPLHSFVRRHGGISVAVGRTSSSAEYGVPASQDVTWFLEWLLSEWQTRLNGDRPARHSRR